ERLAAPLTDPAAIAGRQDSIAWFLERPDRRTAVRTLLRGAPDIARALARLALNRGGPRDPGALSKAFEAALHLGETMRDDTLPPELYAAIAAAEGRPRDLAAHLDRALADELPLLRRDGGFLRSGYDAELDEMRALRDESRRVIATMEREL